jgi:hypothetical protein
VAKTAAHRPPYAPTGQARKSVRAMAAYGIAQDLIGDVLGVTGKTLRKHFRHELDTAGTEANARVDAALFQKATGGDTIAMIFWLKVRAGWKETTTQEIGGIGGKPISIVYSWAEASLEQSVLRTTKPA